MAVLIFSYAFFGLVMVGLAIPLIRRKIRPNGAYGFRFASAMADPEVWYPVNAYGGRLMLIYGGLILAAALLLDWLLPQKEGVYVLLMTLLLLGGLVPITILTYRLTQTLARRQP